MHMRAHVHVYSIYVRTQIIETKENEIIYDIHLYMYKAGMAAIMTAHTAYGSYSLYKTRTWSDPDTSY